MKRRFLTTVLAANEKEDSKSDISWNAVNAEYNTEFADGEYRAIFVKVDIRGAVGKSAEYLRDKIEQYVEKFGKAAYITKATVIPVCLLRFSAKKPQIF